MTDPTRWTCPSISEQAGVGPDQQRDIMTPQRSPAIGKWYRLLIQNEIIMTPFTLVSYYKKEAKVLNRAHE